MTPAKMFDGDLWMRASDATQMAENAYKKGQTDEREACAAVARQWDADHPASNYGGCIANLIEARGEDAA
jgi:hypothetical protein